MSSPLSIAKPPRTSAAPPKRPFIPQRNALSRFPHFVWWIAWPTSAGWMWLILAGFLMLLRAFNLVTLVASFMIALWVINLLFSHLRSVWCLGVLLVLLTGHAVLLALNVVYWPFIIPGAVVALVGCLTWGYYRAGLQQLEANRHVEQLPFAGEAFIVDLSLRNPGATTQRGLRVVDHGKCHYHRWGISALGRQSKLTTKFEVLLPRRGRYPWGPLEISSAYPFGLFCKRTFLPTNDSTIVLPRLGRLHQGKLRRLLLGPTRSLPPLRHQQSRRTLAPADFCGVRQFQPGDSPRFIHWRTTARVGSPMVREFEEPPVEHLLVVLDPWLPRPITDLLFDWQRVRKENRDVVKMVEAAETSGALVGHRRVQLARLLEKEMPFRAPLDLLEKAVSLTATVCWYWGQQAGTKVYLAVAESPLCVLERKEPGSRGAVPLLERLALVIGGPAPDHEGIGKLLGGAEVPLCPVVVVSTRSSPLTGALGHALRRPVGLLDVSQPTVQDLFTTDANAETLL